MAAEPAPDKPFLLYGANGYTGQLIAEECVRRGIRAILAGRNEAKIRSLAGRLGLDHRVFALDTGPQIANDMGDVPAVLLAAGPFSRTSAPVVEACLRRGAHYVDITGEIEVFEAIHRRDAEAKKAGVTLLPGAGFDVVPSDCLAKSLHEALPDADRLVLAFHGVGGASRGTMKTMVEGLPRGGAVRRDGKIVSTKETVARTIPFHDRAREAMRIPWGDVSTAYHSTGIPNIEVYMAVPPRMITAARMIGPIAPLLGAKPIQRFLSRRIDAGPRGPSEEMRERGRSELWGSVEAPGGAAVTGTLTTPEGYRLTAMTAVEAMRRILLGRAPAGAVTPSMAFGASFIGEFEGCELRIGGSTR